MIWLSSLVGAVVGAAIAELHGLLFGGLLGYLSALTSIQNKRLQQLDAQVEALRQALQSLAMNLSKSDSGDEVNNTAQNISSPEATQTTPEAQAEESIQPQDKWQATKKQSSEDMGLRIDDDIFADNKLQQNASMSSSHSTAIPIDKEALLEPQKQSINTTSEPQPLSFPNLFERLPELIKSYFSGGNLIVRIGIIVLFFGVSFLVKYSIEHSLISIQLRLIGIISGALIMLIIGWRLRHKTRGYALMMQGGAIAILYLAIYASFKLYYLLSVGSAFPLLILFSMLAMLLAVIQNSRSLAITAIIGGFASPILASTGSGNYIILFSYYLVLNLAVFAVSWFKSWRLLNVIGFIFTFIIATTWGVTQYRPENFADTEPFLISFFLIYVAIAILFAFKQKPELKGYVDASLVFGVPLVAFGLQAALVYEMEYGLAWSAFALGIFYLSITILLRTALKAEHASNFATLIEAMLALGVIFSTLAIPFALDGRWTSAAWAIEGAGMVWIGIRQTRLAVKYFGLLVQLVGGLLFLADYPYQSEHMLFLNIEFLGVAIVSTCGLFSAYLLDTQATSQKQYPQLYPILIAWALIWWYLGGFLQIEEYVNSLHELNTHIIFFAFSALLLLIVAIRYEWQRINFFPWLLMLALGILSLSAIDQGSFFKHFGYLAWPLAIITSYSIYYLCEKRNYVLLGLEELHAASYLLPILILSAELSWWLFEQNFAKSWEATALAVVLSVGLLTINRIKYWPFRNHQKGYQIIAAMVLTIALIIWSIAANFAQLLPPHPLLYIPLLNPIDIMQAIAIYAVIDWYRKSQQTLKLNIEAQQLLMLCAAFCFIWFNVILFKTLHITTGIAYSGAALFHSAVVQTAISISWTIIGLIVMVTASSKQLRQVWLIGAGLTGVVVVKLFLLDLAEQGSIERISSFIVVGILLLVVGYFSPVPPKQKTT